MICSLRSKIGMVPQEPMLFHDSIMNNIRYAQLTASDEEVYEACKAAAVHEKIMAFPNGEWLSRSFCDQIISHSKLTHHRL